MDFADSQQDLGCGILWGDGPTAVSRTLKIRKQESRGLGGRCGDGNRIASRDEELGQLLKAVETVGRQLVTIA